MLGWSLKNPPFGCKRTRQKKNINKILQIISIKLDLFKVNQFKNYRKMIEKSDKNHISVPIVVLKNLHS